MGKIDRNDMLELTRRMTLTRNCFHRIAGAYFDGDGFVEGTFHTHFQKLSKEERAEKLKIAKAIPFAKTNVELREYRFLPEAYRPGNALSFFRTLLDCDFKDDALLDTFYEMFGERYRASGSYGVFFFYGKYDVPRKGTDKVSQWESEVVYSFLLCAVCPVDGDYRPGAPECGFLYPAYKGGGGAIDFVNVYRGDAHPELPRLLGAAEGSPALFDTQISRS